MRLHCHYSRWLAVCCVVVTVAVMMLVFTSVSDSHGKIIQYRQLSIVSSPGLQHQTQHEADKRLPKTGPNSSTTNPFWRFMPLRLREASSKLPVRITVEEFRSDEKLLTGNPLIDSYRELDTMLAGEMGRGVVFVGPEKDTADVWQKELNFNGLASDVIPLNRMVPDSRMKGCEAVQYPDSNLTMSVIIPFHNEWPSTLLRTLYSLVNRTPRKLLHHIILVDDCSDKETLGQPLQQYLQDYFPRDLVTLLRMPKRVGLIQARMAGFSASSGDVIVFLDSHMAQPLVAEIQSDRHTLAMSVLDYISANSLQYDYNSNFIVRYGFDWRLFFFEIAAPTSDHQSAEVSSPTKPVPGVMMVGSAFAMHRQYFEELGGYDTGMAIWGGENIELAWRVWMCGGKMVHVPCSHVGHITRRQPYQFPDGSHLTRIRNYKRAAEVWMGPYKKFLYENYPELREVDAGDVGHRLELRDRLKCHNFTLYLDTVWPQLTVYDRDVMAWGSAVNNKTKRCLDNRLFMDPGLALYSDTCHYRLLTQGFSLTMDGLLRTTLHCVAVPALMAVRQMPRPRLRDCHPDVCDKWGHSEEGSVIHERTGLCLDQDAQGPVMATCDRASLSQKWHFTNNAPFL